ncbi:MAG: PEP/pyruvate-binding domain-containing protein [Myxococcota bacterium]
MRYFLLIVSFSALSAHFDPAALEHNAEILGYGYKTSNLLELDRLLKAEPYIKVPEFVGIPGPVIQKLLAQTGLNLGKSWSQIIAGQGIGSQTLGQALQTKVLPGSFLASSLEIAEQIKSRFKKLSHAPSPELQAFLARARANNWRLMVRSTGKEDTDKLANAGGNLSVGNVPPEHEAVVKAIGQVIASYFEEKSLSQRLSAGDQTLFDLPLTPVLIQRMIGEELNGASDPAKIPVGCVLYTQESAAKIAEIYTLQCAFGHNEGVVESLVPLDTYYIQPAGQIQSVIKRKTKRMVPMLEHGVFGLEEQKNPESIQTRPALGQAAIQLVAKAGKRIDGYYRKRMDIELVYEPWSKKLYIVQARPLVIPQSTQEPSYLTEVTSFTKDEVLRITSISPGDSAVLRVNRPEEILSARTLEDALHRYTGSGLDRTSLKTVIVQDQADPTSHAAAVFRGDSKTIFVTDDLASLEAWLKEKPLNIMIDSQRGLILNIKAQSWATDDARALFEKRILKSGWLSYPLPFRVSVGAHQPEYCLAPQMRAETFFGEITCLTSRLEKEVRELNRFTELMRARAHCDLSEPGCLEQQALASQLLPRLEDLNTHAHELMGQIRADPNHDLPELLALFPKRFLETLVSQPQRPSLALPSYLEIIQTEYDEGTHFIQDNLKPLIETQILSERILRDPELFKMAQLGEKASLTEKTSQRFMRFVDQIPDLEKPKLLELITAFDNLGILPMWLNGQFMSVAKTVDAQEIRRPYDWPLLKPDYGFSAPSGSKLLAEFHAAYQSSKAYLQTLEDKKAELASYDLSIWSNPKNFEKARQDFKKKFENYFISSHFLGFKNDLQIMAATSIMEQYVELFDNSIKTLKSTPNPSVKNFKTRIEDYLDLLKAWGPAAPQEYVKYFPQWDLQRYLKQVDELLSAKKDLEATELQPSQMFSVAAAAIGAATAFERHFPVNLEDFFTLVHQSLNTFMGAWNTKALGDLITPDNFGHTWRQLQDPQFPVFLTGVRVGNGQLNYSINMPLRNHSAKFRLSYQRANNSVDFTVHFLGPARDRWDMIRDYTLLQCEESRIAISNIVQNDSELEFTLDSVNLNSTMPIDSFKNVVAEIANEQRFPPAVLNNITQKLPGQALADWVLKHEAFGIANALYPESLVQETALQLAAKGANSLEVTKQTAAISLMARVTRNKAGIPEALALLSKLSKVPNISIQMALSELTDSLVREEVGFKEIAQIAEENLYRPESVLKAVALVYYSQIITQEQYRATALIAAEEARTYPDTLVKLAGLELLSRLIRFDLGIESAFELAKQEILSPDPNIQRSVIAILTALLNKGLKVEPIQLLARELTQSKSPLAQAKGLSLFGPLVGRQIGVEEAKAAIEQAASSDSPEVLQTIGSILMNFQIGNSDNEWALKTIQKLANSSSDEGFNVAVNAMNNLLSKNIGTDFGSQLVKRALDRPSANSQAGGLRLLSSLVRKKLNIQEALQAIGQLEHSPSANVQLARTDLIEVLASEGYALNEAAKVAMAQINSTNPTSQGKGLSLLGTLVHRDKSISEALQAINKLKSSTDPYVRSQCTYLLSVLVSQGHALEEVLKIAVQWANSIDPNAQTNGLNLMSDLVQKDLAISEALKALHNLTDSPVGHVQRARLQLISILTSKNQVLQNAFEGATKTAMSLVNSVNPGSQDEGLRLLAELVRQDQAIPEALQAFKQLENASDTNVRSSRSQLLNSIISKGYASDEAPKLAMDWVNDSNPSIQANGLSLFTSLVQKDLAIPEALQAARHLESSTSSHVLYALSSLLDALLSKGKGTEEAQKIALDWVNSSDPNAQARGLSVFAKLAGKELSLPEALQAVRKLSNSTDGQVRSNCLSLIQILVPKGEGLNEALLLVEKIWTSGDAYERSSVLHLLVELVNKGAGLEQAPQIVIEAAKTSGIYAITSLLKALVAQKTELETVAAAAKVLWARSDIDKWDRSNILKLFDSLVEQNFGLEDAFEIASEGVKLNVQPIQINAIGVFTNLVKHDYKLNEINTCLEQAILEPEFIPYNLEYLKYELTRKIKDMPKVLK